MKTDIQIGTKIICIDNIHNNIQHNIRLTLYKVYVVHSIKESLIEIIDDKNEFSRFYKRRFITLNQYRKQKLLKINQTR
jgi:hypothetical protein